MKKGMIPFFIPHMGCPHICVFCNQHRITGQVHLPTAEDVQQAIVEYRAKDLRCNEKEWEVAFYGGTFTAIPEALQRELLKPAKEAKEKGLISKIRCSTRPDDLGEEAIQLLIDYGVTTVEIGVQSMNEHVLQLSERGHTAKDVVGAVQRLRDKNVTYGVQLMPGLPGDTLETIVQTTVEAGRLEPHMARIYPVLVVEDTALGDSYKAGEYTPLSLETAISYAAFMKTYLEEKGIQIIRTGLQATEEFDSGVSLLAGPYAPAFGEMVIARQWLERIEVIIKRLEMIYPINTPIEIQYERAYTSKIRGVGNSNKTYLEEKYGHSMIWKESEDKGATILCGRTMTRLIP